MSSARGPGFDCAVLDCAVLDCAVLDCAVLDCADLDCAAVAARWRRGRPPLPDG